MTHTYQLTGMTCIGCETKVKSSLLVLPDVTSVAVSKDTKTATITMEKHIALPELQKALGGTESKYQIAATQPNEIAEQTKSWFETYKPILLIYGYVTLVTLLIQSNNDYFDWMQWMQHFMAGTFLIFSFFKLLNLEGFAESYTMYDLIAKYIPVWGYFYAFIELALGISFLVHFQPFWTNAITLVVLSSSTIGVLQSVWNKKKIQCACLGAIFDLPMSTVTILENLLMVVMAAAMLWVMI
jgi:copper chaperone CopZ